MTLLLPRRALLSLAAVSTPAFADTALLEGAMEAAGLLSPLRSLIVARDGQVMAERRYAGPTLDQPVNVKSVSKSVIAALVGIAIDQGVFKGTGQPIASVLGDRMPEDPDPRLKHITIGNLLSMQAGLERTSGPGYGAWVASRDWVRFILSRPFEGDPGGAMLYSTGNTHLLSAMLTKASGRSTLALARDWLGQPLDITIPPWPRDPQGIYFGGNDMLLSPRAMLRFGELHRRGGRFDGRRVMPDGWIQDCWTARTASVFTGAPHGYAWFQGESGGHHRYFAWGYGGQMIHVVPDLRLTVVMTSDSTQPAGGARGHARALQSLMETMIIPAVVAA